PASAFGPEAGCGLGPANVMNFTVTGAGATPTPEPVAAILIASGALFLLAILSTTRQYRRILLRTRESRCARCGMGPPLAAMPDPIARGPITYCKSLGWVRSTGVGALRRLWWHLSSLFGCALSTVEKLQDDVGRVGGGVVAHRFRCSSVRGF